MKKTLLSAILLMSSMGLSQAQVLSPGDDNFTIPFNSATYCLSTCCPSTNADLYYTAGGNVDAATSTYNNGSYRKFIATNPIATTTPMFIDIYANIAGNCTYARGKVGIDMSTNTRVRIKAKTASGVATVQFYLADFSLDLTKNGSSTYNINAGGASVIKTFTVGTTEETIVFDYAGDTDFMSWAGRTGVDMYGIIITNGAGVEVQVSEIEFGTAAVVTANNNANVVNDQVNVFPNPAKGAFTVDMTAMNNSETALVKVLNANGNIVKEFTSNEATPTVITDGLVKGIYMVQITAGNKIATKKVVVE